VAAGVQRVADRADPAVHHVARGDHVDAGPRLNQRLAAQHLDRLVVDDVPIPNEAVMAVARIRIERHVADQADLRHRAADRADGPAHEVLGVEGLGPVVGLERGGHHGEERQRRDPERRRFRRALHGEVHAQALDAGHGGNGLPAAGPVQHEERQDQVVRRQLRLGDEAAGERVDAVAARAAAGKAAKGMGMGADFGGHRSCFIRSVHPIYAGRASTLNGPSSGAGCQRCPSFT
jgi:hypothetical protein